MAILTGEQVVLRPAGPDDVADLVRIRRMPGVRRWWRGPDDPTVEVVADLEDPDLALFVVLFDDQVVGAIQYSEENEPDYRHAGIDIFLDPGVHGRGLGTDAVRTLARHLIVDCGHHRLTIDPAADNDVAIRSYSKVGFRPVGRMRQYERGLDGTWHDGLLMDLLAAELS